METTAAPETTVNVNSIRGGLDTTYWFRATDEIAALSACNAWVGGDDDTYKRVYFYRVVARPSYAPTADYPNHPWIYVVAKANSCD